MTIIAFWALFTMSLPVPATVPLSAQAVTPPGVTVKIGNASLEEYRHGDPADRIQLVRGSQATGKM